MSLTLRQINNRKNTIYNTFIFQEEFKAMLQTLFLCSKHLGMRNIVLQIFFSCFLKTKT